MVERPPLSDVFRVFDAVSDSIVLFDTAWRCVYANAQALRNVGATREEVTGAVLWDRFPQLRDTELGRACLRVAETDVAERVESFYEPMSTFFESEIQRTPVGVVVVARDVTALKTAAQTGRRSTERLARLHETMAGLIEAVTRQQVADLLVRTCQRTLGACAASLALVNEDRTELELVAAIGYPPGVTEDWRRFSIELPTPIRDAIRSGDVVVASREERLCRVAVPLALQGRVLGAIGLDFEGRPPLDEELLELLRTVGCAGAGALERVRMHGCEAHVIRKAARDAAFVQATSVLLWVTDPFGHVPEDSPSWRAFTGLSFDDLMTPWGWGKALHPDDRERVAAAWSRAARSKSLFVCEQRFRRHDGAYVWTLGRAAPVLDERGDVVEWVGTNMDISESKRAEEEREARLRFAEQFIGILGHDLRNPINAIQMAAQLLERKAESADDRQRLVERIAASTSRMSNMVAQLLDLTRVRLGTGLRVERKALNLSQVITAAVEELRLVHPTRRVECACEAAVEGSWDPDRLAQVVSNLVGNALQHGDRERPVEVRLATVESAAVFEVQSYGTPIAPDLLPHIFDAYRQGQARSGTSQGLGLGLFITQQIVHAHGGRIEVHSTAAEGTRFTVTLPRGWSEGTPNHAGA